MMIAKCSRDIVNAVKPLMAFVVFWRYCLKCSIWYWDMIAVEMPLISCLVFWKIQLLIFDFWFKLQNRTSCSRDIVNTEMSCITSLFEIVSVRNKMIWGQRNAKPCFLEWLIIGPFVSSKQSCESLQKFFVWDIWFISSNFHFHIYG